MRVVDGVTNAIYVEDVRAGRRPNGATELAVRILNCTGTPLQVEAATQFFDETGGVAEPTTAWKRLFVPPRSTRDYMELSTGAKAASFMVDVRGGT